MAASLGAVTSVAGSGSHAHDGNLLVYIIEAYDNSAPGAAAINSATWGGAAMTLAAQAEKETYGGNDNSEVAIFYKYADPGTATAAASYSGSIWGYAVSVKGAAGAAPIATSSNVDGGYTSNLASLANGIAFCAAGTRTNGHTPLSSTTEIFDVWDGGIGHAAAGGYTLTDSLLTDVGWNAVAGCFVFASFPGAGGGSYGFVLGWSRKFEQWYERTKHGLLIPQRHGELVTI